MREIKFRGKIPETNEWVYGCYWTNGLGNHFIRGYLENDQFVLQDYEVAPETIGQYTGLKDTQGVDVCEGDLVETTHRIRTGTTTPNRRKETFGIYSTITENGIVVYENGKWLVKFNSIEDYPSYFWCTSKRDRPKQITTPIIEELAACFHRYKVVGSIYENPELLEG